MLPSKANPNVSHNKLTLPRSTVQWRNGPNEPVRGIRVSAPWIPRSLPSRLGSFTIEATGTYRSSFNSRSLGLTSSLLPSFTVPQARLVHDLPVSQWILFLPLKTSFFRHWFVSRLLGCSSISLKSEQDGQSRERYRHYYVGRSTKTRPHNIRVHLQGDTSADQFAQNLLHHEGKLSVSPSNGLIKLQNAH
jgi:hypothetical protein